MGRRALRCHIRDDDIKYALKVTFLKDKHLIIQTAVPDKFLSFFFRFLRGLGSLVTFGEDDGVVAYLWLFIEAEIANVNL